MHHVPGRKTLCGKNKHQHGHHDHAATDAEQPREKTDRNAYREVSQPPLHQSSRSRCATSSANPTPAAPRVTYLGSASIFPAKRVMFATPTELSNQANIGASFGESPAKAKSCFSIAGLHMKTSAKSCFVIASLS